MPRRTNEFQQLVHYIYGQLAPVGAKVRESVLLKDSTLSPPVDREVDVLIEHHIAGISVRIAIECRDRHRKADIAWIDELIGRFKGLAIDRVVAVSRSGFTKAAARKAEVNGIAIRTLEEARTCDWRNDFPPLRLAGLELKMCLTRFQIHGTPPFEEKPTPSDEVVDVADTVLGSLRGLVDCLLTEKVYKDVQEYLRHNFLKIFKTMADLRSELQAELTVRPANLRLLAKSGVAHSVDAITFWVRGTAVLSNVDLEHYLLAKAHVTRGVVDLGSGSSAFKVTTVQVAGSSGGKMFVKRLPDGETVSREYPRLGVSRRGE